MSPILGAVPPTCSTANGVTNFTAVVPISFVDPTPLTFTITKQVGSAYYFEKVANMRGDAHY